MIKMQPARTEQMKVNHFHSLLRKGALQTFRNINSINRQTLEDVLVIFRRKYVKPESQATANHKWHRLTIDPSTMKLPDFLEKLNQGAEKAFGENAKSMIDIMLYAKLPPKLKRSVNKTRLENGTYEEIVAHLERELELNALEESDDLPMATMASASTNQSNLLSNGINTNKDAQCSYCKATGHYYKSCPKLKKKKEMEEKDGKKPQRPTYPPCDTCGKKNHSTERCWQSADAHLRPKSPQAEQKDANASTSEGKPKQPVTRQLLIQAFQYQKDRFKKLILTRLQIHDYMSFRQYVISDPPIIKYSHEIEDTKGIPTLVWQQPMEKAYIRTYKTVHNDRPDRFYEIDYTKNFETQFRPLPLIDYHPQYPDPEYGKDPYWDDKLYDRQNLRLKRDDYPPTDDEDDPQIEDTKLSRAPSNFGSRILKHTQRK